MQLIDTHCHIHATRFAGGADDPTHKLWHKKGEVKAEDIIARAADQGVVGMICVGTNAPDSELAVSFAKRHDECWASIGLHPHEAKDGEVAVGRLSKLLAGNHGSTNKIVAIGECGLDYYYTHSPKPEQVKTLHDQFELAGKHGLPLILHVREAFDDFWPIFDSYQGVSGVLHSYTDTQANLDKALARGLFIGLNGIMTFTKDPLQHAMAKAVPLQNLLLETDAPYLTPVPHRGTINEPSRVSTVASFLAQLRGESIQDLAKHTTDNARRLFHL